MVNGTIWKQATGQIRDYVREAQVAAGIRVYNPEYEQLCNTIAKTEMEQEKLIQKMNSMDASKRFVPTQEFKDLKPILQRPNPLTQSWKKSRRH